MALFTKDIATACSSVLTSMSNIGPGFGSIGPTENFSQLNDFAKVFLALLMLIGRLEIFTVLVLFTKNATSKLPNVLMNRRKTIGIRVPDNPIVMAIVEELGHGITQGMVQQTFYSTQWTSSHIRTGFNALNDVLGTSNRSRQYLGLKSVIIKHIYDFFYQLYTVTGNIIQSSHKRRNISSSGFCRQQSLTG